MGAIALKLLAKDPAKRFQNATEVVAQLKSTASDASEARSTFSRISTPAIMVFLVLAVAVIAGAILLRDTNSLRPQIPGRPAVAVLPLEDQSANTAGPSSRGAMIAGLMTAGLSTSSTVRAVSQERILELPPSKDLTEKLARIDEALPRSLGCERQAVRRRRQPGCHLRGA